MASKTDICNLSISHLGISKEIGNVTTEQSAEAKACRRFYDECREAVLTDYSWPFATKFATLGLVAENPNSEWGYSYRYPTDCLFLRRILSGAREDTELTRIAYKIGKDAQGLLIFTDQPLAEVEYTENIADEDLFTANFRLALSYRLASYIAPRITAGDPFRLAEKVMQLYMVEISKSAANAFNENKMNEPRDSPSIQSRA